MLFHFIDEETEPLENRLSERLSDFPKLLTKGWPSRPEPPPPRPWRAPHCRTLGCSGHRTTPPKARAALKDKSKVIKIVNIYKYPTFQFTGGKYRSKGHLWVIFPQELFSSKYEQFIGQLQNSFRRNNLKDFSVVFQFVQRSQGNFPPLPTLTH